MRAKNRDYTMLSFEEMKSLSNLERIHGLYTVLSTLYIITDTMCISDKKLTLKKDLKELKKCIKIMRKNTNGR